MKYALSIVVLLLTSLCLYSQTNEQIGQIIGEYDHDQLDHIKDELLKYQANQNRRTNQLANKYGWPKKITDPEGKVSVLVGVTPEDTPLYFTTYNLRALQSTRTDHLHQNGSLGLDLQGQDMTIYVWDQGGIFVNHPEFDSQGGGSRASYNDDEGGSLHSTHVTGTLIARGANESALGMAPEAHSINYDWNVDVIEVLVNAQNNGMLLSNHSYGYNNSGLEDYYFGAYVNVAHHLDNIMYNAPYYLLVAAAGNDGEDSYNGDPIHPGMDQLTGMALAKNNLTIANVHDVLSNAEGEIDPETVVVSSTSSIGPADDMRIKPDLAGNGTDVYSTKNDLPDGGYTVISGTSMAAPNVSGSLLLLQQHFENLNGYFLKGASVKGVALHTADLLGGEPNPNTGWGLLNAKKAAELITANPISSRIKETILADHETQAFSFVSDGQGPLLVSISWTDPAGVINEGIVNSTQKTLINDLDVRVYDENNVEFTPWLLGHGQQGIAAELGDNISDPYERVDINNPVAGTYTVVVSHKDNLINDQQAYTLIVSGASEVLSDVISIEQLDENQNVAEDLSLDVECGDEVTIYYRIKASDCISNQLEANSPSSILFQLSISAFGNLELVSGNGVNAFNGLGFVEVPTNLIDENGTIVSATFEASSDIQCSFTNTITVEMHPSNTTVYVCNLVGAQITQHPICHGDLNGDGFINSSDLTLILTLYGQQVPMCHPGDFDGDELIKAIDITSFLAVFGMTCNGECGFVDQGNGFNSFISTADLKQSEMEQLKKILNQEEDRDITVYPNPGDGLFKLGAANIEEYAGGSIEVLDQRGKKVFSVLINKTFNGEIDLRTVPNGMYLLKFNLNGQTSSKLLIKSN